MKKVYSLLATLLILKSSFATIHEIQVSNYQFSPSAVTAIVGDTIKWTWVEGTHTTTSVNIPSGAAAWDNPMTASNTTFSYKITVAGTYDFKCTPHAAFGMVGTITASGILPVTFSSFNVSAGKENSALIAWATATELNTDHFEVMRSSDGKNFEKIATVTAAGNSSLAKNYVYSDNNLPSIYQYLYYSLTIVDKDGKKTFSAIKMFANVNGKAKLVVSLSPNPVSRPGHLMLQFNADKTNSMHVQLFNSSGKLIKEDNLSAVAGLNNGHFHIGDVAAGVYTIIFTMDNKKESYQVVVQ